MSDESGQFETCSAHHQSGLKTRTQRAAPVAEPATSADFAAAVQALATAAAALADLAKAFAPKESPTVTYGDNAPPPRAPAAVVASVRPYAPDDVAIGEAVNEFLVAKARAQKSQRYLQTLRTTLRSFASGRHYAPLAAVTIADVERWIFQFKEPKTMKNYLGDLRCFLRWALRRGYTREDLTQAVELPEINRTKPPELHSPEQVRRVLEYARRVNPDCCRLLAIRYFAGIRTAEAFRLREENILSDYIEVPCHKAKTRARRLVDIAPNLRAWLSLPGELRPMAQDTIRKVVRGAAVDWPANVTRHSFVSYHLALHENAGKTALQAGHDEEMTHGCYKALVTKAAAAEYFGIFPA